MILLKKLFFDNIHYKTNHTTITRPVDGTKQIQLGVQIFDSKLVRQVCTIVFGTEKVMVTQSKQQIHGCFKCHEPICQQCFMRGMISFQKKAA